MNQALELNEIASKIRSENDKIVCHARNMWESALRVGELLTEAKSLVKHGEWTQWIEANCEISDRPAQDEERAEDYETLKPIKKVIEAYESLNPHK